MGNAMSPLSGEILKTAAVSLYVRVSKPQILLIRDHLRNNMNSDSHGRHNGLVRRANFQQALDFAAVREDPDQEIFNLLFIMMDTKGSMRVSSAELRVATTEWKMQFALLWKYPTNTGQKQSHPKMPAHF